MNRFRSFMGLAVCMLQWLAGDAVATTVGIEGRTFTVPDGFEVSRVAGPRHVMRPICADFAPNGDLFVADSSGSNEDVQTQLRKKPHRIVRLRDTNGDGTFDNSIVFADRMMFPEGVLCHDGSVYVAAPPSIWKLTDADGDGVADAREEWFQGKTLTGCANDLHGPYAGPDGWIYWCKGAFARQTYDRPGREPWATRAAHIFRRRPDGGVVEPVMTGGMDNPVEVVFTPGGERIFSTTFLQHPAGGKRDGLIHAIYGGVYGKRHSVIDNHPRTGDLMPVLTHLGAAAPSGLCITKSDALGEPFRGNVFSCLFNMHKVMRHVLRIEGATFKSVDHDFLVCDDLDFHPTDVIEDADGSLLVIDTGGWYKLCCPTSQLEKPDVLGAIYRVRRSGSPAPPDPRGHRINWDITPVRGLVSYLEDERPAVRGRAAFEISARGTDALPELRVAILRSGRSAVRLAAVWAAIRIPGPEVRSVVRLGLNDPDSAVRQASSHGVSLYRDQGARKKLEQIVTADRASLITDQNRRSSAEALGRLGQAKSVPHLLNAVASSRGRVLQHSITYALIEIGDADSLRTALADPRPVVRRTAMIALDQSRPSAIEPEIVIGRLTAEHELDRQTALWIVRRHPEWDDRVTDFARRSLNSRSSPIASEVVLQLVPSFSGQPEFQQWLATAIRDANVAQAVRRRLLVAMGVCGIGKLPASWSDAFCDLLSLDDGELGQEAIASLVRLPRPDVADDRLNRVLREQANRAEASPTLRLRAAAAVQGGWSSVSAELLAFLRARLTTDNPIADRDLAVGTLSAARLTNPQLRELLDDVRVAGPLDLGPLLEAFKQAKDPSIGHELVSALSSANSTSALPPSVLRNSTEHFGEDVSRAVSRLLKTFEVDTDAERARLAAMLRDLPAGDVRRGQRVFHSTKAACSACHAMGYLGGTIGPDLTRIGRIRERRDLLEAIVFPNLSFVRSFEPMTVMTEDGLVLHGITKDESETELVLVDSRRQDIRIPRESISEIRPGKVSVMPGGLDQQLSIQQLADLIAFLQDAK